MAATTVTTHTGLLAPPELVEELAAASVAQGLIPTPLHWAAAAAFSGNGHANGASPSEGSVAVGAGPDTAPWGEVWAAVCRVWASKWTDRAWLSRRWVGWGYGWWWWWGCRVGSAGSAGVGLSRRGGAQQVGWGYGWWGRRVGSAAGGVVGGLWVVVVGGMGGGGGGAVAW